VIIQTEQLLALGVPQDRIYIDRGLSGTIRRNRTGLDQARTLTIHRIIHGPENPR
jgi:hypothetical protein